MEILSVLYLLIYALSGIMIARYVFYKDKPLKRISLGLALGLAMLMWLPAIFAFISSKFNVLAQMLGVIVAAGLGTLFLLLGNKKRAKGKASFSEEKPKLKPFLWTVIPLVAIGWILHINHTIVPASDGSLHVGQSTYGDLCMHLGFISSISVQQSFPPDYSLLPGTALGYPFLCDSVSSTFYTLGASLRFSALLPALYAYLVVVLNVYFLFDEWFKKESVTVLATYMFFIGGGLGFAYIFNDKQLLAAEGIDRWKDMIEGFYKTPTNLPDAGLRWVNAIADMLVPQRATLFGWALLFPSLQLLYRAAIEKEYMLFLPLGILAGCLPLVHTHSFLALALVSIVLFAACVRTELLRLPATPGGRLALDAFALSLLMCMTIVIGKFVSKAGTPQMGVWCYAAVCAISVVIIALRMRKELCVCENAKQKSNCGIIGAAAIASYVICALVMLYANGGTELSLAGGIASVVCFAAFAILFIASPGCVRKINFGAVKTYLTRDEGGRNLLWFILFGVIAVLLAAPQVFGFTLKQASTDSFLRWQLNWDNKSDSYLWFYIKNLGLIFILMFPAFFASNKKTKLFYGGGLLIWGISEIMLFQPNPYDNNKLLFVWFALTCGIVSDYLVAIYAKLRAPEPGVKRLPAGKRAANAFLAVAVLTAIFLSGTLTLYREYVSADHIGFSTSAEDGSTHFGKIESGYTVNTAADVAMAEWIKANTEPDTIILTHNNHNNAIAMLTGRNLFVGSGTFLYWHGVSYRDRQGMLPELYENPSDTLYAAAAEYGISYVRVGSWERGKYSVDLDWFDNNLTCVFSQDGENLYRIDN